MNEKIYKRIKRTGAVSLIFGIINIVVGIGVGVVMIVNGAKLLATEPDTLL
jgi:hypothetical protein